MNASEQYKADLKALEARQARRNPKAAAKLNNNIKSVELNTYLNNNSNRYSR